MVSRFIKAVTSPQGGEAFVRVAFGPLPIFWPLKPENVGFPCVCQFFPKSPGIWRAVCFCLGYPEVLRPPEIPNPPPDQKRSIPVNGRLSIPALVAVFSLGLISAAAAVASPLNLVTGTSLSLNPGLSTTGTLTIAATNENAGSAITDFNFWGLILQLIPQPGTVGSATLTSLTNPAVNPALGPASVPVSTTSSLLDDSYTLNIQVNGTINAIQAGVANDDPSVTTFALGQTLNLGDFTVALSNDASGSWTLYALNDQNNTGAWGNDQGTLATFGNLPTAAAGQYSVLAVGTISAVPEPGSLMLAASAITVTGWYGWQSRRRRTVEAIVAADAG
jgi:hypothetical protein